MSEWDKQKECNYCRVIYHNRSPKSKYCTKACAYNFFRGKPSKNKGSKRTIEARQLISKNRKGKNTGSRHHFWIQDRTKVKRRQERNNPEYKQWRLSVWTRDNFICALSNNECCGKIEAHHILRWNDYPDLRYQVTNGITLCHFHHPRKVEEEKRLVPVFQELVPVSKAIICQSHT